MAIADINTNIIFSKLINITKMPNFKISCLVHVYLQGVFNGQEMCTGNIKSTVPYLMSSPTLLTVGVGESDSVFLYDFLRNFCFFECIFFKYDGFPESGFTIKIYFKLIESKAVKIRKLKQILL